MIFFITPLLIAILKGNKAYCNKYCDRSKLLELLGGKFSLSLDIVPPVFLRSAWFRYGFLTFFMTMFSLMVYNTYKVFTGVSLSKNVILLWVFRLPWTETGADAVTPWVAQYAYGFYGVMLTSTILGLITMVIFRPRTWCVYCPMGTMTQTICKIKHRKETQEKFKML
jgi:hypothetical protein